MSAKDEGAARVKAVVEAVVGRSWDDDPEAFTEAAVETTLSALGALWQAAVGDEAASARSRETLSTLRTRAAEAGFDPGPRFSSAGDEVRAATRSDELAEVMARGADALRDNKAELSSAGEAVARGLEGLAERVEGWAAQVTPTEAGDEPDDGGAEVE